VSSHHIVAPPFLPFSASVLLCWKLLVAHAINAKCICGVVLVLYTRTLCICHHSVNKYQSSPSLPSKLLLLTLPSDAPHLTDGVAPIGGRFPSDPCFFTKSWLPRKILSRLWNQTTCFLCTHLLVDTTIQHAGTHSDSYADPFAPLCGSLDAEAD
jgi:hypothetical protein